MSGFRSDLGFGQMGDTYSLHNYRLFLTDPFYRAVFWNTTKLSIYIVAICLILGFPTAYILARSSPRVLRILVPLLLLSSFVTLVVRALGWIVLLGDNGLVNKILVLLYLSKTPVKFLNHPLGVVLGMVHYALPLVILSLMNVVQTIPTSLEQAAESLGASRLHVYSRVVLPLSLPGVLAVSLLIFSIAMGVFASPLLLGGGRVYVWSILIYQEVMTNAHYAMGAAMSLLLVVLVLLINVLSFILLTKYLGPGKSHP